MNITKTIELRHSSEDVFELLLGNIDKVARLMQGIDSSQILFYKEENGIIERKTTWKAAGSLPTIAKGRVPEEVLSWIEHARVIRSQKLFQWWIETLPQYQKLFALSGCYQIKSLGPHSSIVVVSAKLNIDATKIEGIPNILSKSVGNVIERFVSMAVENNFDAMFTAVSNLLEQRCSKSKAA